MTIKKSLPAKGNPPPTSQEAAITAGSGPGNSRPLKVAVNRALIDKNESGDRRLYARGWENVELADDELSNVVRSGAAFCAQVRDGWRKTANFLATDVVSVDIDHGMSLQDALEDPIVREHASFVYTTANHSADNHRFRVVFALPWTVSSAQEVRVIQRSLALRLGGDLAATDPTRISFGNRAADIFMVGRSMSPDLYDQLVKQSDSFHEPRPSEKKKRKTNVHRSFRSTLVLNVRDPIRTTFGAVHSMGELPKGVAVFCPFHQDERASAFVTENRFGVRGIHCSTCNQTYWPDRPLEVIGDFEAVAQASASGPTSRAFRGVTVEINPDFSTPGKLTTRLTLVRSPKGSGKTASLQSYFGPRDRVLLIGHRRLLNRNTSARLGLKSYLDRSRTSWTKKRSGILKKFAVSIDSIELVPPGETYDLIVLDEVEQLLHHFLSDTLGEDGAPPRETLFAHFVSLLRNAKRVVALDADLAWASLYTLQNMLFGSTDMNGISAEPVERFLWEPAETTLEAFYGDPTLMSARNESRLYIHDRKAGLGKEIEIYESEKHLIGELETSATLGLRCFVVSNSRRKIEKIASGLRRKNPALRILLATSRTNENEDVKSFVADPAKRALEYDVILASPTMGTGVDITFPFGAQRVDLVFGFADADITTHLDFDQQIGRVRNPTATKVWLSKRRLNYETSLDVVQRDILGGVLLGNRIVYFTPEGVPVFRKGDLFLEMATLLRSQQRSSLNRLRDNFLELKKAQGYELVHVQPDEDIAQLGRELAALGKDGVSIDHVSALLAAAPLKRQEFRKLRAEREAGRTMTGAGVASLERTRIELFYRSGISEELIRIDNEGRRRDEVMAMTELLPEMRRQADADVEPFSFNGRDCFLANRERKIAAIAMLLASTPITRDGAFVFETEIAGEDLENFVELALRNKAAVESLLNLEVPSDVERKPMQILNRILKLVGLRMVVVRTSKIDGKKIRYYELDRRGFDAITSIISARETVGAWDSLCEVHGWAVDDMHEDEDDEFYRPERRGQDDQ